MKAHRRETRYPVEPPDPDWVAEPEAVYSLGSAAGAPPFVRAVLSHLGPALTDLAHRYATSGWSFEDLGSPADLARKMAAALPAPSPWNQALGPFYGAGQITEVLGGVSRQAVADRRARHTLLALRTSDGQWMYPTFQFDRHHQVLKGLPEVLQTLATSGADDWTLAGWLVSPLKSLDGASPRTWLTESCPLEPLLVSARDAARRFAQ